MASMAGMVPAASPELAEAAGMWSVVASPESVGAGSYGLVTRRYRSWKGA